MFIFQLFWISVTVTVTVNCNNTASQALKHQYQPQLRQHKTTNSVTFYDIWPGSAASCLFLQPHRPQRAVIYKLNHRIFNYRDASLADLSIEISDTQKQPAARRRRLRASQLPWLFNSHGPITDRLTTIINFQHCCMWTVNVICFLHRIVIQYKFWPWPCDSIALALRQSPWPCKAGLGIKLKDLNFKFYQSLV